MTETAIGEGYFTPDELRCKCGRPRCDALTTVTPDLLSRLNLLRHRVGRPLIVTSGLRCRFWNEKSGGEKDSEHLTGEAADLACGSGRERFQLLSAIFESKTPLFTRFGVGASFLHVGVSTTHPREVTWTYTNTTRLA